MKARPIILSLAFCLALTGPLCLFLLERTPDVSIPSWLSSQDSFMLTGSKSTTKPELTGSAFLTGELQQEVEVRVGENIPLKAVALLGHSSSQRCFIEASNALFRWNAYPSFYGSEQIYSPMEASLEFLPTKISNETNGKLKWFSEGIKSISRRYPDKHFTIYIVGAYDAPALSESYELVNDPLTPAYVEGQYRQVLNDCPNVSILKSEYDSYSDYYDDFYRTDVHWNSSGAVKAYNQLAALLGWRNEEPGEKIEFDNWCFFGANARWGLMDLGDQKDAVWDYSFDFSDLYFPSSSDSNERESVTLSGMPDPPSEGMNTTYGFQTIYKAPDGYIFNSEETATGNALLISNSFRANIKCLIAKEYSVLRTVPDFLGNNTENVRFGDRIEESDPNEILFISHPEGYLSLPDRAPNYFN